MRPIIDVAYYASEDVTTKTFKAMSRPYAACTQLTLLHLLFYAQRVDLLS